MGKLSKSLLAISIVILLSIGSIFLLQNDKETTNNPNLENRFQAPSKIQNIKHNKNVLHINSIEMGETIKNHLRNDPSVSLIKHNNKNESHYHKREVTVKFSRHPDNPEIARMTNDINGNVVKYLDSTIVFKSNELSTSELIQYFNSQPDVIFAEPNYIYLQNQISFPNDLLYREQYQWNLPVIQTEAGWDITKGDEKIIIAVVDTGVDLNHPDLRKRLTKGYNVLENNDYPDDDNGHGTHVAGIIASETNNREGIAGITWYNKIMPIKAMGAEGYGSTFDIAKGIIWAADHGAKVINLSLGNYHPSSLMKEAVKYAFEKNAVIISAAGNDNSNHPSFPAAYPEVLGVSAVSYSGQRAPFSNYGDYIDVSAPGVQIPSTYFNKQYAALSGTSMASPHVAGLAGLILSANPNLTNKDVMNIIKSTAYDLGAPGKDNDFGSGLIDVQKALQAVHSK
ncbi:S8 family peptidase [Bacillus methanolicus]|uniref:Peptidase S8/S53 subtilisin kexin sedolisin n=1 Tax=Bacillus methanolicus (strain MGA3 / ATCC 53907) TaxID=796606 RepID=I3E3V5_BACMM|nr:S8 family peptidase [Bacillus methanolicus]AIE58719.1 peptidase S8/S53 subtilisin kexin sedolisin [Bacillus methanolicus MGA3]EIJ81176.1 peptidase S8/S53 subtilisin kexin sedolisin [Bacillus methanolicus MGA3]